MDRLAWLDQHHAHLTDVIRRTGCAVQYVGGDTCGRPGCCPPPDDDPPFAYTIGLFGLGHPELVIVGVDVGTANGVLTNLAGRVRSGTDLMPGSMLTLESWAHRIVPEPLPNAGNIVLMANDFYRRPPDHSVPALQLAYDDTHGRFPWDEGYAAPDLQPRPGTWAA